DLTAGAAADAPLAAREQLPAAGDLDFGAARAAEVVRAGDVHLSRRAVEVAEDPEGAGHHGARLAAPRDALAAAADRVEGVEADAVAVAAAAAGDVVGRAVAGADDVVPGAGGDAVAARPWGEAVPAGAADQRVL